MPLLNVDGRPVHVVDRGSGEAIVFVHAYPLNAAMWDYQADALAERYRVVAVDMPGFGQSPAPSDPSGVRMDHYADIIAGVVQELELAPVVLAGCSMGGYAAFALVRRHPQILRALVLADTRTQADDAPAWQRRTKTQQRIRDGAALEEIAAELVPNLLGGDAQQRPELVEYVKALMLVSEPDGWVGALEAMKTREDSISTLQAIGVPTLVVVGEQDRLTPQTEAALIQARVKDSRLVVVPGAGHLPNLEQPLAFNEALEAFLAGL